MTSLEIRDLVARLERALCAPGVECSVPVRKNTGAECSQQRGAEGRALRNLSPLQGQPKYVGLHLHQQVVVAGATVDTDFCGSHTGIGGH